MRLPSGETKPSTTVGSTITPPLAMAPTARTICIAVTEMPWPNAIVAWFALLHSEPGLRMPCDSPGSSTPDLVPKPNLRKELYIARSLICCEATMVPRLDDFAMTPAAVRCRTPCFQ